jgi:hypothetical protein
MVHAQQRNAANLRAGTGQKWPETLVLKEKSYKFGAVAVVTPSPVAALMDPR